MLASFGILLVDLRLHTETVADLQTTRKITERLSIL